MMMMFNVPIKSHNNFINPDFKIEDFMLTNKPLSKSPPSSSSSMMMELDPLIWSRLPQELLDHILCFLPLKSLLYLRPTCKHFKTLIYTPTFVSKYSSSSPCSSFLLLSHPQCYNEFPLYDSKLSTWRNLVLPENSVVSNPTPLSASNGLLCFSMGKSASLLVSNLLTNSSRVIKFPTYSFSFELLTLVSTPGAYKVFALCSKYSSNSVFVYDSKTHIWNRFEGFAPILNENCHQEGVFSKGCLYFTTPEPFSVVSFDLETGKWDRPISGLPDELIFVRLVSDHAGGLYLIGGVGRNGISRRLKLWKLEHDEGNNWIEIESVPELICKKFMSVCYHNYEHVYCFWHEGMICVCCYTWPEILYYKVSRRTWHWLPKCPSLPDKWSCGFKWFSFIPHLYASV
ncbi:F-box/kelch-repeat protein At5g43190-like [Rutidosis leptorrhynchoides]|uniref:F-box/kelch-repeat protein At5g43190-like n=1 Tax=Rutidosis leptorrhynchoides TaxID=125765 RepID=UPI003A9970E4